MCSDYSGTGNDFVALAERFCFDRFTGLCRLDLGTLRSLTPGRSQLPDSCWGVPSSLRRCYKLPRKTTVKEIKFLRKQADQAEGIARWPAKANCRNNT